MDIDEFLNKESGDAPKEVKSTEIKPIDDVKSFGSGTIADLLSRQLDLWNQLAQSNSIWNESLQSEVSQINRSILSEIKKLDADRMQSKSKVRTEIARIKQLLLAKRFGEAQNRYNAAKIEFDKINDCFSYEKRKLNAELLSVYHEIQSHSDMRDQYSFKESITKIHSLVNRAHTLLKNGQLNLAKVKYEEVLRLYFELPAISIHKKTELGSVILNLYKDVSIHSQIQELQNKLTSSIPKQTAKSTHGRHVVRGLLNKKLDSAKEHIKNGYFVEAKKEIEAVLKFDQKNSEAKKLLGKLPK